MHHIGDSFNYSGYFEIGHDLFRQLQLRNEAAPNTFIVTLDFRLDPRLQIRDKPAPNTFIKTLDSRLKMSGMTEGNIGKGQRMTEDIQG